MFNKNKKVTCPICKSDSTGRVLEEKQVYVGQAEETKKVGTPLFVFYCRNEGHVFFVRLLDLVPAH